MSKNCLNCKSETINNYCSFCGQSTNTHRFSLKHFFFHDFIHGVFHLDKGFLFTLKELYTRPGHSIREYMQGKRKDYSNFFTLMILVIAAGHFIAKIPHVTYGEILEAANGTTGQVKVLKEYGKIAILSSIPIYALITFISFLRSKQNYTEHLVLSMYYTCSILVLHLLPLVVAIFTSKSIIVMSVARIAILLEHIYYYWFLYQYFSVFYKNKFWFSMRCLLVVILLLTTNGLMGVLFNYIGNTYLIK